MTSTTMMSRMQVSSRVLVWDRTNPLGDLAGRFDVVICADCLFFTEVSKVLNRWCGFGGK